MANPGRLVGFGMSERHAPPCPVCGDPSAFVLWIDDEPPPTCPNDPAWPQRTVIGICQHQIRRARQAAELRRLTPDAFDAAGTMIPSESTRAWRNYIEANPRKAVVV